MRSPLPRPPPAELEGRVGRGLLTRGLGAACLGCGVLLCGAPVLRRCGASARSLGWPLDGPLRRRLPARTVFLLLGSDSLTDQYLQG